jgi:hypothetical protein
MLCRACYQVFRRHARRQRAEFRVREMEREAKGLGLALVKGEKPKKGQREVPAPREPVDVADAIRMTDAQLVAALPEAAVALRSQLQGKAQLKAAEILLRSFVVPTPEGPRRFLSDSRSGEKAPAGTQVVIGLHVDAGAAGGVRVGQVVSTLEPANAPTKQTRPRDA